MLEEIITDEVRSMSNRWVTADHWEMALENRINININYVIACSRTFVKSFSRLKIKSGKSQILVLVLINSVFIRVVCWIIHKQIIRCWWKQLNLCLKNKTSQRFKDLFGHMNRLLDLINKLFEWIKNLLERIT